MVSGVVRLPKKFNEPHVEYHARRIRHLSLLMRTHASFSSIALEVVQGWPEHLNRHPLSYSNIAYEAQNHLWLHMVFKSQSQI